MNNLQTTIIEKNNKINNQAAEIVATLLSATISTEEDIHEWFNTWSRTILSYGTHISKCRATFLEKGREIKSSQFPWSKKIAMEFGAILKQLKRIESLVDIHAATTTAPSTAPDYLAFGNMFVETDAQKISEVFSNISVKRIICGCVHSMLITEEGHVYTWGKKGNRLGHDGTGMFPERVEFLENIVDGAAGYSHSFVIDDKGRLWGWGRAVNGRLGIQLQCYDRPISRPRRITVPSPVWDSGDDGHYQEEEVRFKSIMTGSTFTVALSLDNQLYGWGKRGFNGITTDSDVYRPTKILPALYFREISVGCGGYHALALSMSGCVYAWGHNQVGQVGKPVVDSSHCRAQFSTNTETIRPYIIPLPQVMDFSKTRLVVTISVGWAHNLFLMNDGTVLTCGRNKCGQLGIAPSECATNSKGNPYRSQPQQVAGLCNIVQIGAGGQHSVVIDSAGRVWTWGINNVRRTVEPELNILGRNLEDDITHIPAVIPTVVSLSHLKPVIGYQCNFIPVNI
jgi:alpha-tubulin suppressor-like RCC1 family protein